MSDGSKSRMGKNSRTGRDESKIPYGGGACVLYSKYLHIYSYLQYRYTYKEGNWGGDEVSLRACVCVPAGLLSMSMM